MLVGYARTSTFDQTAGFDAQRRDLELAGCKKVFTEQVSSVAEREQLRAAIEYLREDDILVATKLDRVARSMRHLIDIVNQVKQRKAHLRILGMNLDTETATGRLTLQVLGPGFKHYAYNFPPRPDGLDTCELEVRVKRPVHGKCTPCVSQSSPEKTRGCSIGR